MHCQRDILVLPHGLPRKTASARSRELSRGNSSTGSFLIDTEVAEDNEECCLQDFDASMVARGLSQLGPSDVGGHPAFVYHKLEITGTNLESPEPLVHCQHVQQLVLSDNCLRTLQPLSHLQHLTCLDVSRNDLTQVLDYTNISSNIASKGSSSSNAAGRLSRNTASSHSNLRIADLSYNRISYINNLGHHSRLSQLHLDGNQLECIGDGLKQLRELQQLSLCSNRISSCRGLEGLASLQQLALDGNCITSLAPLSGLSGLQVLTAAHNQLASLQGIQGLHALRRLDVSGNKLRRVEGLAACRDLSFLTSLDVASNPLEGAQNVRLHIVHLLAQLRQLNGIAVALDEKVDAGSMVGAATDGLVAIRRHFFPNGELDDGGGAVPPTAAGLKASNAEEEAACEDIDAMFQAVDGWARSIPLSLALQPTIPSTAGRTLSAAGRTMSIGRALSIGRSLSAKAPHTAGGEAATDTVTQQSNSGGHLNRTSSHHQRISSGSHLSAAGSIGASLAGSAFRMQSDGGVAAAAGGIAAIAARLAAGCSKDGPFRQLQLLRACYSWVLSHVQLPQGFDTDAGPDMVTWDVGLHIFGEDEELQLLHQVLLPGYNGTWAECASQLLVLLVKACQMEAVQLSGYWKAGGQASIAPGDRLASHNHSWVAAKVNGRWRLLDPVYALIMSSQDQPLPFFLLPDAFKWSHLPFEACWQLLPIPVRPEEWWDMPDLSLAFAASGGRLAGPLRACNVLEIDREDQVLPSLRIPIAAPINPQQHLCIILLDQGTGQLVATWSQCSSGRDSNKSSSSSSRASKQQQQHKAEAGLVYQQKVVGAAGVLQVEVGHVAKQLAVQELWVSFPHPGAFTVKVEQVTEVPGGLMQLDIEGLSQPLELALKQRQQVLQVKVVVQKLGEQHDSQREGLVPQTSPTKNTSNKTAMASTTAAGMQPDLSTAAADCHQSLPDDDSSTSYNAAAEVAQLPHPQAGFFTAIRKGLAFQLLSPVPGKLLKADSLQWFEVAAPAAVAVAVGSKESGWIMLEPQMPQQAPGAEATGVDGAALSLPSGDEDRPPSGHIAAAAVVAAADRSTAAMHLCPEQGLRQKGLFCGDVVLPRIQECFVAVQWQQQEQQPDGVQSAAYELEPLVCLRILPQVQDLVTVQGGLSTVACPDTSSPAYVSATTMLSGLDVDGDGFASRRDMLLAFRRDRQLADHLKMPPRVRAGDGSFETFLTKYLLINRSGLGRIDVNELYAYLASLAAASGSAVSSRVSTAVSRNVTFVPRSPGVAASKPTARRSMASRQSLASGKTSSKRSASPQ